MPKKCPPGLRNGGPRAPKINKKREKTRSGNGLRKSHRKSAGTGAPRPSKTMVSHCRGHQNHKIEGSRKSHQHSSEIDAQIAEKSIKCLPGGVPKTHRKKVAEKSPKRRRRAPKLAPKVAQKPSKKPKNRKIKYFLAMTNYFKF